MRSVFAALAVAIVALAAAAPAPAQDDPPAVLLVMDASDSMNRDAGNGHTRLQVAKAALNEAIKALPEGARVGLRLYGHRLANVSRSEGCRDTELVVGIGPADKAALSRQVGGYAAKGRTPIGRSLRALLARAFRDYRARGKPIQGGATAAQAVPIATDQWLDSLSGAGQERLRTLHGGNLPARPSNEVRACRRDH